jgi:type IV secretory pathway VirB2 component (pilin)
MSILGPVLTIDTMVELLVIGIGTMTGWWESAVKWNQWLSVVVGC